MELFIVVAVLWAACGIGSYVAEYKRNELYLFYAWNTHNLAEKIVNPPLYLAMFMAAGPIYLAYVLYKLWQENQPFTSE